MFSFIRKTKNKLTGTRFDFSFFVHNLQPWMAGNKAIAIGYQRGKKRRGATRSVLPSAGAGKTGVVVRFNEEFKMPCTLYKMNPNKGNKLERSGSGSVSSAGNDFGPFKKKCLLIAILETDPNEDTMAALGRVVIDLSEFAAIEGQETRTFHVACKPFVHAAVGEPQLMVTIRCCLRKAGTTVGPGGQTFLADDTGSMSTDTTGSRMTNNLSSFLRFRFKGGGQPVNDEQDLGGFGMNKELDKNYMDTIEESHDEPEPTAQQPSRRANLQSTRTSPNSGPASARAATAAAAIAATTEAYPSQYSVSPRSALEEESAEATLRVHSPLPPSRTSPGHGSPGAVAAPLVAGAAGITLRDLANNSSAFTKLATIRSEAPEQQGSWPDSPADHSAGDASPGVPASRFYEPPSPTAERDVGHYSVDASKSHRVANPPPLPRHLQLLSEAAGSQGSGARDELLRQELLSVAAMEASIYLAQPGAARSQVSNRGIHAPARRLARTVVCLGEESGMSFGVTALRLIERQITRAHSELGGLAFWWSNTLQLRAMLQALGLADNLSVSANGGGSINGGSGIHSSEHWAAAAFVPQLARLERSAFDELLSVIWDQVLMPAVIGGTASKSTPSKGSATTKRATQEAAIKKWFEGLDDVNSALGRLGSRGHARLLRQQVLLACLKKLDALMFYHLLAGGEQSNPNILAEYDPSNALWGGPGRPMPQLEDSALPFTRGLLTFGGGMSVKMTVTRLQQWAAAEPALNDVLAAGGVSMPGGADGSSLFPLLRAAADLLMMPKELLMDRAIRLDVCSVLSMGSVLHVLERFTQDEFAMDTINPAILASLHEESFKPLNMRSPAVDVRGTYRSPPDNVVLHAVETGEEPGLEYDRDSEDELEEASSLSDGASARFKLLHDLWINGVPRTRVAVPV